MRHLKTTLLTLCIVFAAIAANAQDKIFKKNGEIIDAKISVINTEVVVFRRIDNPDGPEYTIPKADVARVKYSNGTEDIFEENNDRIGARSSGMKANIAVGKDLIAISPMTFTQDGWGGSITYERVLDKMGWVSFVLPATVSMKGYQTDYTTNATKYNAMYFVMPGIKIYTNINSASRTKWWLGPSLLWGLGTNTSVSDYYSSPTYTKQTHFEMGALASIGFSFFASQNVFIGGDYGMGFSYINTLNGINQGSNFLTQLTFKIGYRFNCKKGSVK